MLLLFQRYTIGLIIRHFSVDRLLVFNEAFLIRTIEVRQSRVRLRIGLSLLYFSLCNQFQLLVDILKLCHTIYQSASDDRGLFISSNLALYA